MEDYTFSYIVYGIMLALVLYLAFKTVKTRTKLGDSQLKFKQKPSKAMIFLTVLLILMVILFPDYKLKIMLLIIASYFVYANLEPIILTDKGIYHNGRFDEWEDLKKWAYNDDKEAIALVFKIQGRDQMRLLPVHRSEKDRILKEIKKHKKKK